MVRRSQRGAPLAPLAGSDDRLHTAFNLSCASEFVILGWSATATEVQQLKQAGRRAHSLVTAALVS